MTALVDDSVKDELSLEGSVGAPLSMRKPAPSSLSSEPHSSRLLSSLLTVETTGMATSKSLIPNAL